MGLAQSREIRDQVFVNSRFHFRNTITLYRLLIIAMTWHDPLASLDTQDGQSTLCFRRSPAPSKSQNSIDREDENRLDALPYSNILK